MSMAGRIPAHNDERIVTRGREERRIRLRMDAEGLELARVVSSGGFRPAGSIAHRHDDLGGVVLPFGYAMRLREVPAHGAGRAGRTTVT